MTESVNLYFPFAGKGTSPAPFAEPGLAAVIPAYDEGAAVSRGGSL